jgi:hypothetical protein
MDFAFDINNPYGSMYSTKYWLNKYRIVHSVEIPCDGLELFKYLQDKVVMTPYDIDAYYYGMLWGILHNVFKIPYPKTNKFASTDKDMCQEIVRYIIEFEPINKMLDGISCDNLTIMTPDMSMKYAKQVMKNIECKWIHNV